MPSPDETHDLPLWHRTDPETSVEAAVLTASGASTIRTALAVQLYDVGSWPGGLTGDEASVYVDDEFPDQFVEYAGRRRLSDLCDPKFGDALGPIAIPTRHRRINRRGNYERVVVHRDWYVPERDAELPNKTRH